MLVACNNVRADRVESVERKESYLLSTLDEATLDDTDGEASGLEGRRKDDAKGAAEDRNVVGFVVGGGGRWGGRG